MSVASILSGTPATLASIYGGGGGGGLPTQTGSGVGTGAKQSLVAVTAADAGVYVLYVKDTTTASNYLTLFYTVTAEGVVIGVLDSSINISYIVGPQVDIIAPFGDAYQWTIVKLI